MTPGILAPYPVMKGNEGMRIEGSWGYVTFCLGVCLALGIPAASGQAPLPAKCLPDHTLEIHWRETFLLTEDLAAAGWGVIGQPSWKVTREALDAGNGDLFTGTAIVTIPARATTGQNDYLVTTNVWNTQRDGLFFVAVRFHGPGNYYAFEYMSGDGRLVLLLVKVRDGVRTVLQRLDSIGSAVHIPDLTYGAGKGSGALISVGAFGNHICASLGREVFLDAVDDDFPDGGIAFGQTNYHPYFDDVTVYLPVSPEGALPEEAAEPKIFRIPVPDRDEGNAVVMDLTEMGVGPVELRDDNGSVSVIVGPLESQQDIFDLRGYLELGGYASEEIKGTGKPTPTEPAPEIEGATPESPVIPAATNPDEPGPAN